MPPSQRKRRMVVEEAEDAEEGSSEEESRSTQRRRRRPVEEDDDVEDAGNTGRQDRDDMDVDEEEDESQDQLVKKLVRYALACEYSRQPIKREGIKEKVVGKQRVPMKQLFESAQTQLRTKFGMEMTELPVKEKVTLKDRRAAQKVTTTSVSSNSWVLTSTLPSAYRLPALQPPSLVPTAFLESSYVALYTTIISLISLSGGTLSDDRLTRYLHRLNADVNLGPLGATDLALAKMVKQGYLIKVVEGHGDEETRDWMVGPRGKIEVGNRGVKELVMKVYGGSAPDDLAKRVKSSLGVQVADREGEGQEGVEDEQQEEQQQEEEVVAEASGARRGRSSRRRPVGADED